MGRVLGAHREEEERKEDCIQQNLYQSLPQGEHNARSRGGGATCFFVTVQGIYLFFQKCSEMAYSACFLPLTRTSYRDGLVLGI